MARRKIIDLDAEKTASFDKKGDSFQGYYLGSRRVNTGVSESNLHIFSYENENVGVWGSAKLDQLLGQVPKGTMTYITYGGKRSLGGGKTLKMFDVECDDENVLEGITTVNSSSSVEESSSDDSDLDIDEVDDIIASRS